MPVFSCGRSLNRLAHGGGGRGECPTPCKRERSGRRKSGECVRGGKCPGERPTLGRAIMSSLGADKRTEA